MTAFTVEGPRWREERAMGLRLEDDWLNLGTGCCDPTAESWVHPQHLKMRTLIKLRRARGSLVSQVTRDEGEGLCRITVEPCGRERGHKRVSSHSLLPFKWQDTLPPQWEKI